MKNCILIFVAFVACFFIVTDASAQKQTKVSDGICIVTYGNVTVVENDNTRQTVQIKVLKKDGSLYDIIFCGNKFVKTVTKRALREGIRTGITNVTGGTLTWLSKYTVDATVNAAYDAVCSYYNL